MGIATPKTGQIAFSDLNVGIMNAGSTASLNMNTAAQRLGYGGTGQVSISNLRGCAGGTLTVGYRTGSKFIPGGYGYDTVLSSTGSATGVTYQSDGTYVAQMMDLDSDSNRIFCNLLQPDASPPFSGWQGTNLNRAAFDNAERTITSAEPAVFDVAYTMPTSGTINWGLRWA
jgi:hypothetical protein